MYKANNVDGTTRMLKTIKQSGRVRATLMYDDVGESMFVVSFIWMWINRADYNIISLTTERKTVKNGCECQKELLKVILDC